jgi:hypothetical protein
MTEATKLLGYVIEPDQMQKLRKIADRLCGGSDKMRDEGNALVLVIESANEHPLFEDDEGYPTF